MKRLFAAITSIAIASAAVAQERPKNLDLALYVATVPMVCGQKFLLTWGPDMLPRLGLQELDLNGALGRFGDYVKAKEKEILAKADAMGDDAFCDLAWKGFGPNGSVMPGAYRLPTKREVEERCCKGGITP